MQAGQNERLGWLTDRFLGNLKMQTLRNEPMAEPRTKAKTEKRISKAEPFTVRRVELREGSGKGKMDAGGGD